TIQSIGNVNLIDLRVAKVAGDTTNVQFNLLNPLFWLKLLSDQVEASTGTGQIWGMPFNFFAGAGGAGNLGVVSDLDHKGLNPPGADFEIDYQARFGKPNFWPMANNYVNPSPLGVNPLDGYLWNVNFVQPAPTLHKALPGDTSGTILTVPDVAHGDPESQL